MVNTSENKEIETSDTSILHSNNTHSVKSDIYTKLKFRKCLSRKWFMLVNVH